MCGTFRYWTARWTLQPWFCRAAWHSSVVTPCTVSCTWGEPVVSGHHHLPSSEEPVAGIGGHSVAEEHHQPGAGTILISGIFSLSPGLRSRLLATTDPAPRHRGDDNDSHLPLPPPRAVVGLTWVKRACDPHFGVAVTHASADPL